MSKEKKFRILKSENHLSAFLEEGASFYIGLLLEDFLKSPNLSRYGLPRDPSAFPKTFIPAPRGSATKANIKGKYVRKQPEEKTDKKVHIKYTRKDGIKIEYDRIFHVYVKMLLHLYNIELSLRENSHGQKIVVSPRLRFENTSASNTKNTHVINMFCEVFNDFEVFTDALEPAIPFNKQFDQELLPQGKLADAGNFDELVQVAGRVLRNEKETRAFHERLKVIQEYNPDILGKGSKGFLGYIVFGFTDKGIVILESMYHGNATYVFDVNDYEEKIVKDKQVILNGHLAKRRFFHHENWEPRIRAYLSRQTQQGTPQALTH